MYKGHGIVIAKVMNSAMKTIIFILSASIVFFGLTTCSAPEKKKWIKEEASIAKNQQAEIPQDNKFFPHQENWKEPENHGVFVLKSGGTKNCATSCHGGDLRGGSSKISCFSCHKNNYPHEKNWTQLDNHGKKYLESKESCSTKCHGQDLKGGLSQISCTKCHTIYPHSSSFGEKSHGQIAKEAGIKATCATNCHGQDLSVKVTDKSCLDCHTKEDFPEIFVPENPTNPTPVKFHTQSDWTNPKVHGVEGVMKKGGIYSDNTEGLNSCKGCHGGNLTGGGETPSCLDCHEQSGENKSHRHIPSHINRDEWTFKHKHGAEYLSDKKSCATSCHGEDLKGGLSGTSCTKCHNLFPHPEGFADPDAHKEIAKKSILSCATDCHGKDLKNNIINGSNCYSCHSEGDFFNTPNTQPIPSPSLSHKVNWSEPTEHGKHVLNNGGLYGDGVTNCRGCHGGDLGGSQLTDMSCSVCHEPLLSHLDRKEWTFNFKHGKNYLENKKNCTTTCHGEDLKGGLSSTSCTKCHKIYPHPTGWLDMDSNDFHLNFANKKTCATGCHAPNGDVKIDPKKCIECHGDDNPFEVYK